MFRQKKICMISLIPYTWGETMKITFRRLAALFLALAMFCAVPTPASAVEIETEAPAEDVIMPRASEYLAAYFASISETNGTVEVTFDVTATGRMTSVGATTIRIKDSSGATVKTFEYDTTPGMMGYNRISYAGSVTYQGIPGKKYYASVTFKAANSSGSDTGTYVTPYT